MFKQDNQATSIQKRLEFYFVFDKFIEGYENVFDAIKYEILQNYQALSDKFSFENDEWAKLFLKKLARNDRKKFTTSRHIPRRQVADVIKELLKKNIIKIEPSKELRPQPKKHEKLKKELRGYQIQDKIHFKNNFTRFWFRF